jgi:hypothetical protein
VVLLGTCPGVLVNVRCPWSGAFGSTTTIVGLTAATVALARPPRMKANFMSCL